MLSTGIFLPLTLCLLAFCVVADAATYYVRVDGGSRYSDSNTNGQCNGMTDAPYSGSGTNGACAFGDIRYLWARGVYCDNAACWNWVGAGGDTYIVDQKAGGWRIGWNSATADGGFGIAGDPFASGAPAPPSGTASNSTRILGRNWQNCVSDSSKTQVFGGFRVGEVFNFRSVQYVQMQCFDISDHHPCGSYASAYGGEADCGDRHKNPPAPYPDYADTGIASNNQLTHSTFTNIKIHGMAGNGWVGPIGDGVVLSGFKCNGNSIGGMNLDVNDGTTGTGTLTMSHFELIGNGCCEMWPIDPNYKYPYRYCTDDKTTPKGYGDAFGTATITSDPAWIVNMDHSEIAFNTQDGIDALHLTGTDSKGGISQLILNYLLSYSNMGSQAKFGSSAILRNSIIYDNPTAMGQAIPDFPPHFGDLLTDFGRGEAGVGINYSPGKPVIIEGCTMYSSSNSMTSTAAGAGVTSANSGLIFRNNIQVSFINGPGSGKYSNRMYAIDTISSQIYSFPQSIWTNNLTFNDRYPCPRTDQGETSANVICGAPGLFDETYHLWGYGDVSVKNTSSRIIGFGVTMSDNTGNVDFDDNQRRNPLTIDALEVGSPSPVHGTIANIPSSSSTTGSGPATTSASGNGGATVTTASGSGSTATTAAKSATTTAAS